MSVRARACVCMRDILWAAARVSIEVKVRVVLRCVVCVVL